MKRLRPAQCQRRVPPARAIAAFAALLLAAVSSPAVARSEPRIEIVSLEAASKVSPGAAFGLEWALENLGEPFEGALPFEVTLSSTRGASASDRSLFRGELSLEGPSQGYAEQLTMPADVPAGAYYLGLRLDPDGTAAGVNLDRAGFVSEAILVSTSELEILTTSFPTLTLGSSFCSRLDASGGDGIYAWSLLSPASLPPGISLVERYGGGIEREVVSTRLCGTPAASGTFEFKLQVASAGSTAVASVELRVDAEPLPLRIGTAQLPMGLFNEPYEAQLLAAGGRAGYRWSLRDGRLPTGVALRKDGVILGASAEDGAFEFTVSVEDAEGQVEERALELLVASPARLSCIARVLPRRGLGEPYEEILVAAGGTKPYRWKTLETRRLASIAGETSLSLGAIPPPGLGLGGSGQVTGNPTEAGLFLWTVEVSDFAEIVNRESCTVLVEFIADPSLVVATTRLSAALVGREYRAALEATGGAAPLRWRLVEAGSLPQGLQLLESGAIEGTPGAEQLGEESARTFPFLVEVRDSRNRSALASLSITVRTERAGGEQRPKSGEPSGGCAAASSTVSLASLAALAMALASTRRRAAKLQRINERGES